LTGAPWYVDVILMLATFVAALYTSLTSRRSHTTLSALRATNETQTKAQQDAMTLQATSFSQAVKSLTESFQSAIAFRDGQSKFQQDALAALQQRVADLEAQRQHDHAQIDDLCDSITQRDQQVETLQQSLKARADELAQAQELIAKQAKQLAELDDLKKRVTALEQQVKMLSAEREQLIKERDAALKRAAELQDELTAKSEALARAEAELAAIKAKDAPAAKPDDKPAEVGAA